MTTKERDVEPSIVYENVHDKNGKWNALRVRTYEDDMMDIINELGYKIYDRWNDILRMPKTKMYIVIETNEKVLRFFDTTKRNIVARIERLSGKRREWDILIASEFENEAKEIINVLVTNIENLNIYEHKYNPPTMSVKKLNDYECYWKLKEVWLDYEPK